MMDNLLSISSTALCIAFFLYLIATVFFSATIRDKNTTDGKNSKTSTIAITITILGFLSQLVYVVTRWIASGHAPVSNMFEFVTFLGFSIVLAFIILHFMYKVNVVGLFALPVAMIVIAYGSMFPTEISPLVASLRSDWLYIHVTTVSLSQGILAISFVTGLIYLLKSVDQTRISLKNISLEAVLFGIIVVIGYVAITTGFGFTDYKATFEIDNGARVVEMDYRIPPITGPADGELVTTDKMSPLFDTPGWMKGADAPIKLNTVIWSFITGVGIYLLLLLILRKRIGKAVQPALKKVKLSLLDEMTYRAVAIGFPLFTLGGLIFASIWAQIAWDRFWGWDPKEVWALITWFFYAAFLHLRLSRGWHGERSAW